MIGRLVGLAVGATLLMLTFRAATADNEPVSEIIPAFSLPYLIPPLNAHDSLFSMPDASTRPHRLLIFFTYADCYAGLAQIPWWSELRMEVGDALHMIGVATGGTESLVHYFVEQQGIDFPVIYDRNGQLFRFLESIGQPITPVLALVTSEGTIVDVRRANWGSKESWLRYTASLDSLMANPGGSK